MVRSTVLASLGSARSLPREDGEEFVRLLFERPVAGWSWQSDPIAIEVAEYAGALARGEDVGSDTQIEFDPGELPDAVAAASAWLLIGDEASYPTSDELDELLADADVGIFDLSWTAAKQTQVGGCVDVQGETS